MVKANKLYQLGIYEKAMPSELSWDDRFHYAHHAGYDFVEISIDESEMRLARLYEPSLKHGIKRALDASGMKARTICLSAHRRYPLGSHDSAIRAKSLDIFKRAVDLAVDLGATIIQLAGYDVYYETSDTATRRHFMSNLKSGVEYASSQGILCAFETMETPFMNTVEKAVYFCGCIGSPYLQLYPDLGNLTNGCLLENKNLYDDLDLGKHHLLAAHLKETKPDVYRDLDFGEGHVDFEKGIQKLWDLGVRIYNAEYWHDGRDDFFDRMQKHALFLSCYLDGISSKQRGSS